MDITINLSLDEVKALEALADSFGQTVSECARNILLDAIEDSMDLATYHQAMRDPQALLPSLTLSQVEEELGIKPID